MPLKKKNSKLEHKLYLARESREITFDLSECDISEIPSGVPSLCRVLQKEALLLHSNHLTHLKAADGKENLSNLRYIRLLDIHSNKLIKLPDDFGQCFEALQILNLEDNRLHCLPASLSQCKHLQTLNVKNNQLKHLLPEHGNLLSIRLIDISHNARLHSLPREFYKLKTLEHLIVSSEYMKNPDSDTCSRGTKAIMEFLCQEAGVEYKPPSHYTLGFLEAPKPSDHSMATSLSLQEIVSNPTSIMDYERLKEERRQRVLSAERELCHSSHLQKELARKASKTKDEILSRLNEMENEQMKELLNLQNEREKNRQNLVHSLQEAEENAAHLVENLIRISEAEKRRESALDEIERDRIEKDRLFEIYKGEADTLRRQEILRSMELSLSEDSKLTQLVEKHMHDQYRVRQRAQHELAEEEHSLRDNLDYKRVLQKTLLRNLAEEEQLQKEAFACLQMQKDARTQQYLYQIELIEKELFTLSRIELDRRRNKKEEDLNTLAERRAALIELLQQFMDQKERREKLLTERLAEMERQKDESQVDYWMIQYQRLMDRKPEALMNREHQLESCVYDLLEKSDALDFLPHFQRHRISIETLLQMTDEDLSTIGVSALGTRRSILRNVALYKEENKSKKIEDYDDTPECFIKPSAPTSESKGASAPPLISVQSTTPEPSQHDISTSAEAFSSSTEEPINLTDVVAHIEVECCVCLVNKCEVLFMNCGHVCCCCECGPSLSLCPLCRCNIVRRVILQNL